MDVPRFLSIGTAALAVIIDNRRPRRRVMGTMRERHALYTGRGNDHV